MSRFTSFELVANLNKIAGNPITGNWKDILKQDKIVKLELEEYLKSIRLRDTVKLRDDITDILVTVYGLAYRAGFNADQDMRDVMEALFTRFDRTPADAQKTREKFAAIGVETYIHEDNTTVPGEVYYVTKSAYDQTGTDGEFYPAGKFLKSYAFRTETFQPLDPVYEAALDLSATETKDISVYTLVDVIPEEHANQLEEAAG